MRWKGASPTLCPCPQEIQARLKMYGLKTSGTKTVIIARLESVAAHAPCLTPNPTPASSATKCPHPWQHPHTPRYSCMPLPRTQALEQNITPIQTQQGEKMKRPEIEPGFGAKVLATTYVPSVSVEALMQSDPGAAALTPTPT